MGKPRQQKKQSQRQLERMPAGSPLTYQQAMSKNMGSAVDENPMRGVGGVHKRTKEVKGSEVSKVGDENEMIAMLDQMLVEKECKLDDSMVECNFLRTGLEEVKAQFEVQQRKSATLAEQLAESQSQNKLLTSEIDEAHNHATMCSAEVAKIKCDAEDFSRQAKVAKDQSAALGRLLEESQAQTRSLSLEIDKERGKSESYGAQMVKLQEIAKESVAQWHWSGNEDQWHSFDMAANPELERAYQSQGGQGTFPLQSGMHSYDINFDVMSQTNTKTGKKRTIRRKVFGVQNTDPLKVVQLVLAARSQETEALKGQLVRANAEVEAQRIREKSLESRCDRKEHELEEHYANQKGLRHELESAQAMSGKYKASLHQAQESIEALKADMQKMQDKARGTQAYLIDAERAQQAAEAKLHQVQGELTHALAENKRMNHEVALSRAASDAHMDQVTQERDALMRKISEKDDAVGAAVRSFSEFWKVSPQEPKTCEESKTMVAKVSNLFKNLSHKGAFQGQPSRCHVFQKIQVRSVQSLHNGPLWSKYTRRKDELRNEHIGSGIKAQPLHLQDLNSLIECAKLDPCLNEVFLAHGCDEAAAQGIMQHGFDIRHTNSHGGSLYGEGMYFSTQLCKCHRYTDAHQASGRIGHIIIARVVLGDPCMLKGQYDGRLPQLRVAGDPRQGRYDSHVVDPAVSNRGQAHWEYVVFDGTQAYPEMLVTYTIP